MAKTPTLAQLKKLAKSKGWHSASYFRSNKFGGGFVAYAFGGPDIHRLHPECLSETKVSAFLGLFAALSALPDAEVPRG